MGKIILELWSTVSLVMDILTLDTVPPAAVASIVETTGEDRHAQSPFIKTPANAEWFSQLRNDEEKSRQWKCNTQKWFKAYRQVYKCDRACGWATA